MRRADAPRPGWYPDPTGDHRLRWWDGTDWTDHRRIRPPRERDGGDGSSPAADDDTGSTGSTTTERGARAAAAAKRGATQSDQTAAMLAEARKVARDEVDKAVRDVKRQVDHARWKYEPMVREYLGRARRWLRTLVIAAVIVVVLWVVLQTIAQVSLLDWLGERVDAVTAVSVAGSPWPVT